MQAAEKRHANRIPSLYIAGDVVQRTLVVSKIISGGQTGADRAALDFAIERGIPHGGWCPAGRLAEDGPIPDHYRLTETPGSDSAQRTEWNVRDSDGTVVFSIGETLKGGSKLTLEFASRYGKPVLHISRELNEQTAATKLAAFVVEHTIKTLNAAGPRASEEPEVALFVLQTLRNSQL
jgi:hypothetical protein